MAYIKVSSIFNKLKQASKDQQILYIEGSAGMGKTAAAEYYFRRKSSIHFHGESGFIKDMPPLGSIEKEALIFDDISQIIDSASRDYILDAIEEGEKQIVLIGRGNVPQWLSRAAVEHEFLHADNSDLLLTDENILELIAEHRHTYRPDTDEIMMLREWSRDNTLLLLDIIHHLPENNDLADQAVRLGRQDFFYYLDHALYERLDHDVQRALVSICRFDSFDLQLFRHVTAAPNTEKLLDHIVQSGDFVAPAEEERYVLQPIYRDYFLWKQPLLQSEEQIAENYDRAAVAYELSGEPFKAMECYSKSGNNRRLVESLQLYAEQHPGMEDFRAIRKYYAELTEEQIKESPALMAGQSLLMSLGMNPTASERWVSELEAYIAEHSKRTQEHKEALSRLYFLNLILPHRDKGEALENIQTMSEMEPLERMIIAREQSIIDSTPSAINAAAELSELIYRHKAGMGSEEFLGGIQSMLEAVFGGRITCYMDLLAAEYQYETGGIDSYRLSERLNELYLACEANGAFEMCFIAIVLQIRDYLDSGKMDVAVRALDNFIIKARANEVDRLLPALEMYRMRLQMIQGDIKNAQEWMKTAPATTDLYTILDRQYYIEEIRILITLRRWEEALVLIDLLEPAFETYHRPCNSITVRLLKAILLYRRGEKNWEKELTGALKKAQRYGYLRLVAEEGAAIKPLLDDYSGEKINADFLRDLKKMVNTRTLYFPNYMKIMETLKEPLTDMEQKVIRLMCSELPSERICDMLCISYSGLKFHRQNIYRKFEVNNRHDAQRVAKSLGLHLAQ